MKRIIIIALVILPEVCICQQIRGTLDFITPNRNGESFSAIFFPKNNEHEYVVRIDTNSKMSIVDALDPSIRTYANLYFLNDSIILCENRDSKMVYYNYQSRTLTQVPIYGWFKFISNNRAYVTTAIDADSSFGFVLWKLDPPLQAQKIGQVLDRYEVMSTIDTQSFLIKRNSRWNDTLNEDSDSLKILDPDMSIRGKLLNDYTNLHITVWKDSEDFYRKYVDPLSLFRSSGLYIPNSNYVLGEGFMTAEEGDEAMEKYQKEIEKSKEKSKKKGDGPHGVYYEPGVKGYWIIGDNKTKLLKKIGYLAHEPAISSSGRHILLFKKVGDSYNIKVVLVKELVEGIGE